MRAQYQARQRKHIHDLQKARDRSQRGAFAIPYDEYGDDDDEYGSGSEDEEPVNPFAPRPKAVPVTNPFAQSSTISPFGHQARSHLGGHVPNPFDRAPIDPLAQMSFGRGPEAAAAFGPRAQTQHPDFQKRSGQPQQHEQTFPWSRPPSTAASDNSAAPKTMQEAFAQYVCVTTDAIPGATISKVVSRSRFSMLA